MNTKSTEGQSLRLPHTCTHRLTWGPHAGNSPPGRSKQLHIATHIGRGQPPQGRTSTHRMTIHKVTARQGHCPMSGMITPDMRSHACIGRALSPRSSIHGDTVSHTDKQFNRYTNMQRDRNREKLSKYHEWDSLNHKGTAPRRAWSNTMSLGHSPPRMQPHRKMHSNGDVVSLTQEHSLTHKHSLTHSQRCGLMPKALVPCGSAFTQGSGQDNGRDHYIPRQVG